MKNLFVWRSKKLPRNFYSSGEDWKFLHDRSMAIFRRERKPKIFGIENATQRNFKLQPKFVYVKSWFVVIFGINATSDISKLLYIISRAVRRVKFETILKYHEWYLCQISRTNHAIICLYYYPQKVCNFHMWVFQIKLKHHCSKPIKLQKFLM